MSDIDEISDYFSVFSKLFLTYTYVSSLFFVAVVNYEHIRIYFTAQDNL